MDLGDRVEPHIARSHIVIPARMASTRLPRKMLLEAAGKPLIQHTYEAARQAKLPDVVCVATDDEGIATVVRRFGGHAILTPDDLASGTDRVAYVSRDLDAEIIVNVQGDEPEISPAAIDGVVQLLQDNPDAVMSTVATPIRKKELLYDPACVKVVRDNSGRAIYFSRSVIPHPRSWTDDLLEQDPPLFYQHLGLYAYRRDFLLQLTQLSPSPLETTESLEQLRVLQAGYAIEVGVVEQACRGIDTESDYEDFVHRMPAA